MPTFFTVDRSGALAPGLEITTRRHTNIEPPFLQDHVDFMFPEGVSKHGDSYFLSSGSRASVASPAIELLFEYVRRAHFPNKPSRFTSIFAVDSLSAATAFNRKYGGGTAAVWEVESAAYFRGNMGFLTTDQTNLACSYFAHLYWAGEAGPVESVELFWEFLLPCPVKVLQLVVPAADVPNKTMEPTR